MDAGKLAGLVVWPRWRFPAVDSPEAKDEREGAWHKAPVGAKICLNVQAQTC